MTKNQALELVFQIYPPNAAGKADVRKSTWMSPIIDGEEAIKMLGTIRYQILSLWYSFDLTFKHVFLIFV